MELPSLEDREREGQCSSGKLNIDGDRYCYRIQHQTAVGHCVSSYTDKGGCMEGVLMVKDTIWKHQYKQWQQTMVKNRAMCIGD